MWLTDLVRAGNTQQVLIEALPELALHRPRDRSRRSRRRTPIVTADIAHTPAFELSFLTETDTEREQARFTLGNGVPVLLRTPPEDGIGNLYFAVLEFARAADRHQRRSFPTAGSWSRPAGRAARPRPLRSHWRRSSTAYVKATFATYAILKAQRVSYDAVAYDWAGAAPRRTSFPWPPDDV